MGGARRAALLLPLLALAAGLGAAGSDGGAAGAGAAGGDPLSRLGSAAWDALERGVGREPLRLVAESLGAALWTVSSGISVGLATLCTSLGDVLGALGLDGPAVRSAALSPAEVQRLLLWGLALLLASRLLLAPLLHLLLWALRWLKLCGFLWAFVHVATAPASPTAQAALLLALWALWALLGRLAPRPAPTARLEATVRGLEAQVMELRRRLKSGAPRSWPDD